MRCTAFLTRARVVGVCHTLHITWLCTQGFHGSPAAALWKRDGHSVQLLPR